MSGMCNYPPNGKHYCRTQFTIKIEDGHAYCPHHVGIVRANGSPYPVAVSR